MALALISPRFYSFYIFNRRFSQKAPVLMLLRSIPRLVRAAKAAHRDQSWSGLRMGSPKVATRPGPGSRAPVWPQLWGGFASPFYAAKLRFTTNLPRLRGSEAPPLGDLVPQGPGPRSRGSVASPFQEAKPPFTQGSFAARIQGAGPLQGPRPRMWDRCL